MELTLWILLAFLTSTLSASESASANSEREQTDQGLHFKPDQGALEQGQCFTTYYCRGTATIPSKPEKTPTCEFSETVVGPDGAIIHTTCPDGPPKPPRCGKDFGDVTCDPDNGFGSCCSKDGYCGTDPAECSVNSGCQSGCTCGNDVDANRCGVDFGGKQCDPDGPFGGCCSRLGYCGKSYAHCEVANGCQHGCADPPPADPSDTCKPPQKVQPPKPIELDNEDPNQVLACLCNEGEEPVKQPLIGDRPTTSPLTDSSEQTSSPEPPPLSPDPPQSESTPKNEPSPDPPAQQVIQEPPAQKAVCQGPCFRFTNMKSDTALGFYDNGIGGLQTAPNDPSSIWCIPNLTKEGGSALRLQNALTLGYLQAGRRGERIQIQSYGSPWNIKQSNPPSTGFYTIEDLYSNMVADLNFGRRNHGEKIMLYPLHRKQEMQQHWRLWEVECPKA